MKKEADFNLDKIIREKKYYSSPDNWEEQVLYFLMVDRFATGNEEQLYRPEIDYENAIQDEKSRQRWEDYGDRWNGGTIQGIISKLDYLENMGVTALWLSPVFKQVCYEETYHGYGIQNFLKVDPHLGSENDLIELVEKAHERDIYIILDIILNHSGNVFSYQQKETPYRNEPYEIKGFHDEKGKPTLDPDNPDYERAWPEGGIWPQEIFTKQSFTCKGDITDWNAYPEYVEGDFYSLKNINTGEGPFHSFEPSRALKCLTECYKYWIATSDIDGFRLDTVKHMEPGATRYFATEIKEFSRFLGKKNFQIIGEITGGIEFAIDIMNKTGLDAALGINRIPGLMEDLAKGYQVPREYFDFFKNHDLEGEDYNKWYQNNVITMFDDHDMIVHQGNKARFAADKDKALLLANAIFINLFTPGIPCLYYGTEQGFDGSGNSDKYVRETMFDGEFGAFRSRKKHFFNPEHPVYLCLSRLAEIRQEHLPLQTGRQYLREIARGDENYHYPETGPEEEYQGVTAWSRIFSQQEYLLAVNSNQNETLKIKAMVDSDLHKSGDIFYRLYSSDDKQTAAEVEVHDAPDNNTAVTITVPAAGHVIYRFRKNDDKRTGTNDN